MNSLASRQTNIFIFINIYLKTIRPQMVVYAVFIIGTVYIKETQAIDSTLIVYALLMIIAYGIVVIQNDLSDYQTDILNNRYDIPLVNNEVSTKSLTIYLAILTLVGASISFAVNPSTSLWLALYIFLGWLYSGPFGLKGHAWAALAILGISYGVMPWLLPAMGTSTISESLVVVMIASFTFAAGIISLKDFKDYQGDKRTGKNTLLVSKGVDFTHRTIVWVSSSAYLVLMAYLLVLGNFVYAIISLLLFLLHIYRLSNKKILNEPTYRGVYGKSLRMIFYLYACLLYAFVLN